MSRSVRDFRDGLAGAIDRAIGLQAAGDALEEGLSHLEDGPQAANEHGADADVSRLVPPDLLRPGGHGQVLGLGVEVRIDGDGDQPVAGAAQEHQDADIEPDDQADGQQGRTERHAKRRDTRADGPADLEPLGPQAHEVAEHLEQSAGQAGADDLAKALAAHLAALQDLGRGDALGELQLASHDEASPQRDGEEHAEHAAEAGDDRDPLVVERLPGPQQNQGRQREDAAGGDGFARTGAGLHDVVFEDVVAFEEPQDAHGDDRRGDRGRHRHAGKQAQVGVGRGQDRRQQHAQDHALDCDFGK